MPNKIDAPGNSSDRAAPVDVSTSAASVPAVQLRTPSDQVKTESPLVSVVIRSTCRPELSAALDSVVAQTYRPIEVVLVDVEGRGALEAAQWSDILPCKVVTSGNHLSRGRAANLGLDAARGKYIVFLDDDDWFLQDHVSSLASALMSRSDVRAAYSGIECQRRGDDGTWRATHTFNERYDRTRLLVDNYLPMHSVMFESALIGPSLRFDEALEVFEDWDFWIKLSMLTRFAHVDRITAIYRISDTSGFGLRSEEPAAVAGYFSLVARWHPHWTAKQVVEIATCAARYLRDEQKAAALTSALSDSERRISELESVQDFQQDRLDDLNAEARSLKDYIVSLKEAAAEASVENENLSGKLRSLTSQYEALRQTHNALVHRIARLQSRTSWQLLAFIDNIEARKPEVMRRLLTVGQVAWWVLTRRLKRQVALARAAEAITECGLFVQEWYAQNNPDVLLCRQSPIYHWLTAGWKDGRDPNPLFDVGWYLEQYPDVKRAKLNPLVHYMTNGAAEGRDPNPLFDTDWYLLQNPDVAEAELNPLAHYLHNGGYEGRDPCPAFDAWWYLSQYPDVARAHCNPLVHYLEYGKAEGRRPKQDISPASLEQAHAERLTRMLPSTEATSLAVKSRDVGLAVIIPVYDGDRQLCRCIDSVLKGKREVDYHVILVNDCSPNDAISGYLAQVASDSSVTLIENSRNEGFIYSVNRGMELAGERDVILLNSDTEVPTGWADKLVAHACRQLDVATITPFSNNATICSYPDISRWKELPGGETVQTLDEAFGTANLGRTADIPTGVGFCMFIRRKAIRDVGVFDIATFGRGYGEENDLCLRASERGWRNVLAADVFVYHEGEVSFSGSAESGKKRGLQAVLNRYPHYSRLIQEHVAEGEVRDYRVAATACRYRRAGVPVVLLVTHALGGGTEKHVGQLIEQAEGQANFLILRPLRGDDAGNDCVLQLGMDTDISVPLASSHTALIVKLLQSFAVQRIHIHHLFGFPGRVHSILRRLGVPFDFTAHDFFAVCPRINLLTSAGEHCGQPPLRGCMQCLEVSPPELEGARDIVSWRLRYAWLLNSAERVICPSQDTAHRLSRYAPRSHYYVVPHEPIAAVRENIKLRPLRRGEALNVGILGELAPHKGRDVVVDAAMKAAESGLPIELTLIGSQAENDGTTARLRETGRYDDGRLAAIIDEVDPHVLLFPARWPETYSYTLTAGLRSRRPLVVSEIGAFIERVQGHSWVWLIAPDITADDLLKKLLDVRRAIAGGAAPATPTPTPGKLGSGRRMHEPEHFYRRDYVAPVRREEEGDWPDLRVRPPLIVMAEGGDDPSPCSYIRLLLPLSDQAVQDNFSVRCVDMEELTAYTEGIVITNRLAIAQLEDVERLLAHVKQTGLRLVYDIDDDLLELPWTHPESASYLAARPLVLRMILEADSVWVSTTALKDRLAPLNSNVDVVRNASPASLCATADKRREAGGLDTLHVLYMGTATHTADFDMVRSALHRLASCYPGRVVLTLAGVTTEPVDEEWCVRINPPAGTSYPAFMRWLSTQGPFDVGIAPLVKNTFNECKSDIKVLDYAALGLPTIASDLEPYRNVISDRKNGLLVQDGPDAWFGALEECLLRPELLRAMNSQVHNDFVDRFAPSELGHLRSDLLMNMVGRHKADSQSDNGQFGRDRAFARVDLPRDVIAEAFLQGCGIVVGAVEKSPVRSGFRHVKFVQRLDWQGDCIEDQHTAVNEVADDRIIDDGGRLSSFDDGTLDFVIAYDFVAYSDDPVAAVEGFCRVLRPGGRILLAVPAEQSKRDSAPVSRATGRTGGERRRGGCPSGMYKEGWSGTTAARQRGYEPGSGADAVTQLAELRSGREFSGQGLAWTPSLLFDFFDYCRRDCATALDIHFLGHRYGEILAVVSKADGAAGISRADGAMDAADAGLWQDGGRNHATENAHGDQRGSAGRAPRR